MLSPSRFVDQPQPQISDTSAITARAVTPTGAPTMRSKPEKRWTWKKPKDKPKRPLSAYNLFFCLERQLLVESAGARGTAAESIDDITIAVARMLSDTAAERRAEEEAGGPVRKRRPHRRRHGKISFANMAKTIAERWKNLDRSSRTIYEAAAALEKRRYKEDLERWNEKQRKKKGESSSSPPAKIKSTVEDSKPSKPKAAKKSGEAKPKVAKKKSSTKKKTDVSKSAKIKKAKKTTRSSRPKRAAAAAAPTSFPPAAAAANKFVPLPPIPKVSPEPHMPFAAEAAAPVAGQHMDSNSPPAYGFSSRPSQASLFAPIQQDQLAAAAAATANTTHPIKKNSSASDIYPSPAVPDLSAAQMAELLAELDDALIGVPAASQEELLGKDMLQDIFDEETINFLISSDFDAQQAQLEQDMLAEQHHFGTMMPPFPPQAPLYPSTLQEFHTSNNDSNNQMLSAQQPSPVSQPQAKPDSAEQSHVPVPDTAQKVVFMASSA